MIGVAIIAGFLLIVMGVGAAMFGSAMNRTTLDEIKSILKENTEGQKVIIQLLKELIVRFDAHHGPPSNTPPPSRGEGGGRSAGS